MTTGDDSPEGPPVRILKPGDTIKTRLYGVRPDILSKMQTCCEQRDYLKDEIKTIMSPPCEGLVMKTRTGDIIFSLMLGGLIVLATNRN